MGLKALPLSPSRNIIPEQHFSTQRLRTMGLKALPLYEVRQATQSGERMSREHHGALRRKIGGTCRDFFKSYVDVDGECVDKTCKVCKKDTRGEARQVNNFGKYVHLACLEKYKFGNFFTGLFSR